MLADFANVLIFMAVAVLFLGVSLFMSRLFRYTGSKAEERYISYECGEDPTGNAWIQFNIRFYVFALIFIIFDVEVVFLFPWAVVFKELGMFAFVEGLIFIAILMVGLAYLWAKGDLAWVKPEDLREQQPQPRIGKVA